MAEAVNQGVADARAWCRARNLPLQAGPVYPAPATPPVTSLAFTEEMKGFMAMGQTAGTHDEYQAAAAIGKAANAAIMFHVDIEVADVDTFITSPAHEARAHGYIESDLFGGRRLVSDGTINLLVNAADPTKKNMFYRLFFTDPNGKHYTLAGFKDVQGPSLATLWSETTTLYMQVLEGDIPAGQNGPLVGSGIVQILPEDFFFKQLFSFRTQGPTPAARLDAMNRFGAMFMGKIWDVYGHQAGPF
jgi:cholesterol oxidase